MKTISFAVPCYNSEKYMNKCIDSLLIGGKDIEIIIVNDGSTDNTAIIAEEYKTKYPDIIKVIHKENGGHGDAVNSGLKEAKGEYFKVVDSDDWFDENAYRKYIDTLNNFVKKRKTVDLVITNFVYYKMGAKRHKVMKYKSAFTENEIFTWNDKININYFQYILMHSVTFRKEILLKSNLILPKHTFYVDNIFLFKPLPLVNTMYYMNIDLYQYLIGREDQSVNEQIMIKRIDQQIRVNKKLIDIYSTSNIKYKALDKYMLQYLDMMMCVASVMLIMGGEKSHLKKKRDLWKYLKTYNKSLYWKMRLSLFGIVMNLPGRFGRFISKTGYHINQKIFGFN